MIIQQLSMFLENKPGRLYAAIGVLAENGINISALSLADAEEYGILRLIVDQPEAAKEVLTAHGIVVKTNRVIAVAMEDQPGGAVAILRLLSEAAIGIEYMYACVSRIDGKALMVLRPDDRDRADRVLRDAGFDSVSPSDIYRI